MLETWLSVIALVLSAISLGWTMHRSLTKRARLHISAQVGQMIDRVEQSISEHQLQFTVTNVGERPVTLNSWGIKKSPDRHFYIQTGPGTLTSLPQLLRPGETMALTTPRIDELDETLIGIYIHDAAQNIYWCNKRDMKKVIAAARDVLSSESSQDNNDVS